MQVLAEVLQQQARLDDPTAAARQEYERYVHAFSFVRMRSVTCTVVVDNHNSFATLISFGRIGAFLGD